MQDEVEDLSHQYEESERQLEQLVEESTILWRCTRRSMSAVGWNDLGSASGRLANPHRTGTEQQRNLEGLSSMTNPFLRNLIMQTKPALHQPRNSRSSPFRSIKFQHSRCMSKAMSVSTAQQMPKYGPRLVAAQIMRPRLTGQVQRDSRAISLL